MPCEANTNWKDGSFPHVNPDAVVSERRMVQGVLAIRVSNATIRKATISDVFELAAVAQPFNLHDGRLRAEVKCCWYGHKPPETWMQLTLGEDWELLQDYSGEVADDIAGG